jgi:hypothetical protein
MIKKQLLNFSAVSRKDLAIDKLWDDVPLCEIYRNGEGFVIPTVYREFSKVLGKR